VVFSSRWTMMTRNVRHDRVMDAAIRWSRSNRRGISVTERFINLAGGARSIDRQEPQRQRQQQQRSFAVYAVGEGWTGALGTGRFDETIAGHDDEEEVTDVPVLLFDGKEPVSSLSLGWGHTALIVNNKLLLTGRPHDFPSLLRLSRLPRWMRIYSAQHTFRSSRADLVGDAGGLDPTSLVGRVITWLMQEEAASSSDNGAAQPDWDAARQLSLLPSLTELPLPDNEIPKEVVCSAGFSCVRTERGTLYSFGLNTFGQCGIGVVSTSVWRPQLVTGLSADFANIPRAELPQSHPIQAVRLGLQHAVCLNSEGEMFTWGKGERG